MTLDEFFPLVVERAWDTTPRARAATFRVPEQLREMFAYRTGQYIKVRLNVDGAAEEHAYSLCSSREADEPLTIAVKRSDASLVASRVQELLHVGNTVMVCPPKGAFGIPLDPSNIRTVVLVAGGSGITPLWAIAKSVLVVEPFSRVVLVYANATADEVMFARELEQLRSEVAGRLVIAHVLENVDGAQALTADAVHHGRISVETLVQTVTPENIADTTTEYLLCGPGGMIDAVSEKLLLMGASVEHIHFESFSSTAPTSTFE
ncbi:MAG: FAD-binding oxidoreductase [Candidatus Kapaibacterium sp.]